MAWVDIPEKLTLWDAEPYADNTKGTSASRKLIMDFTNGKSSSYLAIPVNLREEFEAQVDYRYGACVNLRNSRAADPKKLKGV